MGYGGQLTSWPLSILGGNLFKGEGLKNVALIGKNGYVNEHFMVDRLLQRGGGLDKSYFYTADLFTPNLFAQLKERNVTTVVGLGETVLNKLLGEKDILRWRGRVVDWNGLHIIPALAPDQLLPKKVTNEERARLKAQGITALVSPPRFQGTWMLDAEYAIRVAREGFKRRKRNYIVDPTVEEFDRWATEYFKQLSWQELLMLSWDVETAYKQKARDEDEYEEDKGIADGTLLRVSFSYRSGTGVSVPWGGGYLDVVRRLLASSGIKVVWNGWTFDIPVVGKVGFPVNGMVYDGMDMFHVYQSDLPKGLEFVSSFATDLLPWKHLNYSDPGLYSAIDADAAHENVEWLINRLHHTGQWTTYLNQYARLQPAMVAAGKRGNYIDIPKRDELRAEFTADIEKHIEEVQSMVPREVKPRKVWLNPPVEGWMKYIEPLEANLTYATQVGWAENGQMTRDFDMVQVPDTIGVCSACGLIATNKTAHFAGSKTPKLDADGEFVYDKKTGKQKFSQVKNPCKVAGGVITEQSVTRFEYHEVQPFNPNSSDQMKAYAKLYGHPIGQNKDDHTKESMDSGHIKTLVKAYGHKHPVYAKALLVSKLSKAIGTYIYEPDADNLIHTTYKNAPSTPRYSSANVNLQNVGKREDNPWATRAREQIIARPGHRFVQADSSAIEALMQGWWMGDTNYMELATQSIHAWAVAMDIGLAWTGTEEQVSFIKGNYKAKYNQFKTTNYLTNFGGGPYLMHKTAPDVFPTLADAERAQNRLFELLPSLRDYHHWVRTKAQKESYLELPGWKHRHYYYDVFTTDGQSGKVKLGKDAKRSVAFFPQGGAAAFMRDNLLLLAYGDRAAEWLGIEPLGLGEGYLKWFPANIVVHDGYTLEPPDGSEQEAADALEKVLTRPIHQLGGLLVGCEIDVSPVGGNWGGYSEDKTDKETGKFTPGNYNGLKTVKVVRAPVVAPPQNVRMAA